MGKSTSTLKNSIKVHNGTKKYQDLCGRLCAVSSRCGTFIEGSFTRKSPKVSFVTHSNVSLISYRESTTIFMVSDLRGPLMIEKID